MNRQEAEALVKQALEQGGLTVDGLFLKPTQRTVGYWVGGKVPPVQVKKQNRDYAPDALEWFVNYHAPVYIGLWLDEQGTLHIDAAEFFYLRSRALAAAAERGEKAVYEIATGQSIEVPK